MRGFSRLLKTALVVSIMLGTIAVFGGLDAFAPRNAIRAGQPKPAKRTAKATASPVVAAPINPAREPALQLAPASFTTQPETSLAQTIAASPSTQDARLETSAAKNDQPPILQTPETKEVAASGAAAASDQAVRLAAATAPLAAPTLAPIPALVTKFTPAKLLFGAVKEPANMATRSIGFYARGCLAGAAPLPVNGPAWQAMRLSRNRMWGHPSLVKFIERFAKDAKTKDGWPGLLVGDMSMPRGGPMPSGHASHQVGLDVDIWYKPMPGRTLTDEERETIPMESFLSDPAHVNPKVWTPEYVKLLRRAVSYPQVARIFVNPAIKKWLCDNVKDERGFLHKIQPIPGHDDHFHVRLVCPADNPGCRDQPALPVGDGCGKGLDTWIAALSKPAVPAAPVVPVAPAVPKTGAAPVKGRARHQITLAQLPLDCRAVLQAPPAPTAR